MNLDRVKEIVRYLIVGVLTTIVSLAIYYTLVLTVLDPEQPISLQLANVISWFGAVLFAYVTNRKFVFQSKNTKVKKEVLTFFGSRVVTLLFDMAIMFVGVSVLSFSDKWMKLLSQVVVTILNYIFSKLFVFRTKKSTKKVHGDYSQKIILALMYVFPILDLVTYCFHDVTIFLYLSLGFKIALFLFFTWKIYRKPRYRGWLSVLLIYFLIEILFVYCKGYAVIPMISFLIQVLLLPVAFFYFQKYETSISQDFFYRFFVLYLLLFGVVLCLPHAPSLRLQEVIAILCLLMPLIVKIIFEHKNYFTKCLGFSLLFLVTIFSQSKMLGSCLLLSVLLWIFIKKMYNYKALFIMLLTVIVALFTFGSNVTNLESYRFDRYLFDERLIFLHEQQATFENANLDEQWFGIYGIKKTVVRMDLADLFYLLGYIGFVIVLLSYAIVFYNYRGNFALRVGLLFAVLASFFSGGVFISGTFGIILAMSSNIVQPKEKRILIISNMYPSKKYKHFGSFVLNCRDLLVQNDCQVDLAVKVKCNLFVMKFITYSWMYIQAYFKSFFYSYDYIYVHFTSQSGYAALPAKWCSKTKLVCNVHGNDIVPDYDFEPKNVKRSKFSLQFADKVICPSQYFYDVLVSEYHIPKEKLFIFPSGGINFDVMKKMDAKKCKEELGLDTDCTYYGMVSRIEKDKGYDVFLNAMGKLNKDKKLAKVKLLFIGTGALQNEFVKLVKKNHLEDKVIQKDFVSQKDLVKYYNAMDLFVFPTKRRSESLGLVGLEAMACQTFVIGCNVYGPREYLFDHENCLAYQKDDELISKVLEFQQMNYQQRQKIITAGYQTALKYDVNSITKDLMTIFN